MRLDSKLEQSRCIFPDQPYPTSTLAYPYCKAHSLAVLERDVLFEVAGVDGGFLIFVELAVHELQRHGCFAHATFISEVLPSPSTTTLKKRVLINIVLYTCNSHIKQE